MHDGQYVLRTEFVAIMLFFYAPPLLLALLLQSIMFVKRRIFANGHGGRALLAYVGTILGGALCGAIIDQLSPPSLSSLLGVQELIIGDQRWPVMPLAFVAVAIAATAATFWGLRGARAQETGPNQA